jgi:hypothetical protein
MQMHDVGLVGNGNFSASDLADAVLPVLERKPGQKNDGSLNEWQS